MTDVIRPTLAAFEQELRNRCVVRDETGARVTGGKRSTDNYWVIEDVAQRLNLTNVRSYSKVQNIGRIIAAERTLRFFTAEATARITGPATAAATVEDNTCAVIAAADGLRVIKTALNEVAAGFQPYSIVFTLRTAAVADKLKNTFNHAAREFNHRQDWLFGPLVTAIDAQCGCAGVATVLSSATTPDGMVVQKVSLPTAGFKPFTLEFQITNPGLGNKFNGLMARAADFCGEADWLRTPIRAVTR